jgi:hypothetical protein
LKRFIILALIVAMIASIIPHAEAAELDFQKADPDIEALNKMAGTDSQPEMARNPDPSDIQDHARDKAILESFLAENDSGSETLSANPLVIGSNLDQIYKSISAQVATLNDHSSLGSSLARATDSNLKDLYQGRSINNGLPDYTKPFDSSTALYILQKRDASRLGTLEDRESDTSIIQNANSNLKYIYEKIPADNRIPGIVRIADSDMQSHGDSNLDYLYKSIDSDKSTLSDKWIARTDNELGQGNPGDLNSGYQILENCQTSREDPAKSIDSNLSYLNDDKYMSRSALKIDRFAEGKAASDTRSNLNSLLKVVGESSRISSKNHMNDVNLAGSLISNNFETLTTKEVPNSLDQINHNERLNYISLKKKDFENHKKNYAIVIGIDKYQDRYSLHNSVNDADTFASLLELYGYDTIKLTDETVPKPTKHNILDVALKEVKEKKDRGNVIIYFSGHGKLDDHGNYYLIPRDANGTNSTFISENELSNRIKDIKNLAIIIDACNSGALRAITSNEQMILTSSRTDEASNEQWMGSLSVFTGSLCDAIKERDQTGNQLLLQRCFEDAYNNTVRWASGHLLSQTPIIVDMTSTKKFSLTN